MRPSETTNNTSATTNAQRHTSIEPTVEALAASWRRALLAQNKSPRTIETYLESVTLLARFLTAQGMPLAVSAVSREHVEAFIADLLATRTAGTAHNRYRACRTFFNWCVEEDEIHVSPMARMKPPTLPEHPPEMLSDDELRKLLRACEGKGFAERRDTAIIRLLENTGMRRQELAGMLLTDLDLDLNVAHVMGKFSRARVCPFGRKTALALDRYLRVRAEYGAPERALWLGGQGPLTGKGIYQMVRRRARQAGLDDKRVFLHLFRHNFAHTFLAAGGQAHDLKRLAGWRSDQMVGRYGASAADARAREAYQRLNDVWDRL